jgi:hypothetical protein
LHPIAPAIAPAVIVAPVIVIAWCTEMVFYFLDVRRRILQRRREEE